MNETTIPASTPPAPAAGSDDVEAAVLRHLRDIRAEESHFPGRPISEDIAVDMAWTRYSKTILNEELACVLYYILDRHVKPHNVLWAKLREITIRLMANPKGIRPVRRVRKPNTDSTTGVV